MAEVPGLHGLRGSQGSALFWTSGLKHDVDLPDCPQCFHDFLGNNAYALVKWAVGGCNLC